MDTQDQLNEENWDFEISSNTWRPEGSAPDILINDFADKKMPQGKEMNASYSQILRESNGVLTFDCYGAIEGIFRDFSQ